MLAYARGDTVAAIAAMRAAAVLEDKTELASVTPGPFLPAREMLGEILLELGKPAEALAEFRASLMKEPNRFWSLYGAAHAAKLAGEQPLAQSYAEKLRQVTARADHPGRPQLVDLHDEMR